MDHVKIERKDEIAIVTMCGGKVHALSEEAVEQILNAFKELEKDVEVDAVIFTGEGKFFSFGLDIPKLIEYRKMLFARFLTAFTDLYRYMFVYPKPIIAALNGHTIAGGCMLAASCDVRLMVSGKAKISLNEITFGSSVFAGATAILKYLIGGRNAEEVLLTGKMFTAEEANEIGLVDEVVSEDKLMDRALEVASEYGAKDPEAYAHIKKLLREPLARLIANREEMAISEFNDIWYSEKTRENLRKIEIKE